MSRILVTGCAGFIGFHLSQALLQAKMAVTGVDNLNDYYDPQLKRDRLRLLQQSPDFSFEELDLSSRPDAERLFERGFDCVVHLAAQAGVRHSLVNPHAYVQNNVTAFLHVLEGCRRHPVKHLLFASSSSVYGESHSTPFKVTDGADKPVSLYAATKLANEHMAYSYAHLFGIPTTGLRFFTVYGPWGRPDMAYFTFTKAIMDGSPIELFAGGTLLRDFTYVDDVVEALARLVGKPPAPVAGAPFALHNIGNHQPVQVVAFVNILEDLVGTKAIRVVKPMQPGDVSATCADVDSLADAVGFRPSTELRDGLARFVAWYKDYRRGRR